MNIGRSKFVLFTRVLAAILVTAMVLAGPAAAAKQKDRFFTLTLISPIGNAPREKAAQIIARDLEKIGIRKDDIKFDSIAVLSDGRDRLI